MRAATLLYFLSYLLFSALTKYLGTSHPGSPAVDGLSLLPASVLACSVVWLAGLGAEAAFTALRRHRQLAHQRPAAALVGELRGQGVVVTSGPHSLSPHPVAARILPMLFQRDVVVAAAASAAVLLSSTLAYSRPEVSLLLPLLLMKGGVNLWGPVVSWLRGDGVTARARVVLCLALSAVVAVLWNKVGLRASLAVTVTVAYAAVYVLAYFPKLEVMSRRRGDVDFLVAEMTTTLLIALPVAVAVGVAHSLRGLGASTVHGSGLDVLADLPRAFLASWGSLGALLERPVVWLMAAASEGAGIFGGLVFLARVSSTLSVPLNRCASLLAGFVATVALWSLSHPGGVWGYVSAPENRPELVGVGAMLLALWIGLGTGTKGGSGRSQSSGEIVVRTVPVLAT